MRRSRTEYVAASAFAWAYAGLGDADQTFTWLDKAFVERSPQLNLSASNPLLDSVRSDARFDELLEQLGLPSPNR